MTRPPGFTGVRRGPPHFRHARIAERRAAREKLPGVRWVRSYYSAEEGKLYCEYETPSSELLAEHATEVGLPLDRATVVRSLEPSMFW